MIEVLATKSRSSVADSDGVVSPVSATVTVMVCSAVIGRRVGRPHRHDIGVVRIGVVRRLEVLGAARPRSTLPVT